MDAKRVYNKIFCFILFYFIICSSLQFFTHSHPSQVYASQKVKSPDYFFKQTCSTSMFPDTVVPRTHVVNCHAQTLHNLPFSDRYKHHTFNIHPYGSAFFATNPTCTSTIHFIANCSLLINTGHQKSTPIT